MMLMDSAAEATTATGTTGGTLADMLPPCEYRLGHPVVYIHFDTGSGSEAHTGVDARGRF